MSPAGARGLSWAGAFLLAQAVAAQGQTLPELFQRVKEQFRAEAYAGVLETLDRLDTESRKEGFEKDRSGLEPAIAFYRGASLAALGKREEARAQFEIYLGFRPDATLDSTVFPRKVIAALEDARKALRKRSESGEDGSFAAAYGAFVPPSEEKPGSLGEDWANGPVRFLLTSQERADYSRLSDAVSRSEFVTSFWKARDPKPETPENELRIEFEKRMAFADARFTQGETKGSLTDRGMVFILLGPPTYAGRKPLMADEEADSAGLSRSRAADARIPAQPRGRQAGEGREDKSSARVAKMDALTGPGRTIHEAASNWRDVWHYRRENLPKTVPYLQVDFEFVTKRGYGENVLQRDAQPLDALERAKAALRVEKSAAAP